MLGEQGFVEDGVEEEVEGPGDEAEPVHGGAAAPGSDIGPELDGESAGDVLGGALRIGGCLEVGQ